METSQESILIRIFFKEMGIHKQNAKNFSLF